MSIEGQRKKENTWERSSRLFHSLLKNADCGFAIYNVDQDKTITLEYVSEGFCSLCGGCNEKVMEAFRRDSMFGVQEEYAEAVSRTFQKLIQTGEPQEVSYLAKLFVPRICWLTLKLTIAEEGDGTSKIYAIFVEITEQIKAQEELKEASRQMEKLYRENLQNEEALKMACTLAGMWTFTLDLKKKECYPDRHLQEDYSLPAVISDFPESLIAMHLVHPSSEENYRRMISNLSCEHPVTVEELQVRNLDGGFSWMRYTWHITELEDGCPVAAIGYARFIDGEKQQQARLNLERKKLLGGDKKLTAYAIINLNAGIVEECNDYVWNSGIANGDSMEMLVEKIKSTMPYEEERNSYNRRHDSQFLLENYNKGITSWETNLRFRDEKGFFCWQCNVESIMHDPDSDAVYLYEYLYDIHAEVLLEDFIEGTARTEYELIGTLALDTEQFYTIGSMQGLSEYQTVGYGELCSEYIETKIPENDRVRAYERYSIPRIREKLAGTEKTYHFIERCVEEDGSSTYKKITFSRFEKTSDACFYNRRDITETIHKEEQANHELRIALSRAEEATRAKSAFLSRMSHELRTPLNAIQGYATVMNQYMEQQGITDATLRSCMDSILKAGKYQMSIIGDLLDIQMIDNGKMILQEQETEFAGFLENIVSMIGPEAREKGVEFSCHRDTQLEGSYLTDAVRLQQVLMNLLYNAVKFTDAGGSVELTADIVEVREDCTILRYCITDTGIGMSEEFQNKYLFQSFAQEFRENTSPYEGCGTGLAISKKIVDQMGGEITCMSEQGKGTRFTVVVPVKNIRRTRRRRRKTAPDYDLSGIRILLCEDNPMNQDMERRLLERMKCEVEIADDGAAGLEKYKNSEMRYFDMVLMDIRMPNMDGLEAARAIRCLERADAKEVPILAVSANAFEEDVMDSLEAGMNEHLAKPVHADMLYERIKRYCGVK